MDDAYIQALQHRLAMYEQLASLYPREASHLQKKVEVLLQLKENDKAELLLEKLHDLLLYQGDEASADETKLVRQHLSQQQHQEHFYSTPFLHLASSNFIEKLFRTHRRVELTAGNYLMHYGDKGEAMFIVLSGSLAVWSRSKQGKKNFEHLLHAGEVIGEIAFLDGTPRNADVLACQDTTLLAIPHKEAVKLLLDNPKVEQALRQEADIRKMMVALKKNKHLIHLPEHLQRILAKQGQFIEVAALKRLYHSNQAIEHIDLVCEGKVRLMTENNLGASVVLDHLTAGGLLGLGTVNFRIGQPHYMVDVVCMQNTKLLRFPAHIFIEIIEHNPRLHQALVAQAQAEQGSFIHTLRPS